MTDATAPRVGYAGEPGAFGEDAVLAVFGDIERVGLPGFGEVFEGVESGAVDAGVIPIENVTFGTVRENYDLLLEHQLQIRGDVVVPVRLCLAALPGQRLEAIHRVYSHIQALGQAQSFLRARPWQLLTTYNTAGAGSLVAERHEPGSAAVLAPRAADLFGLEVLALDIQDDPDNRTRFLVIARPAETIPRLRHLADSGSEGHADIRARAMRTTLVLGVRNEPGALVRVLEVFADRGLNMSKLESRPSRELAWEYVFWIDLDVDLMAPEAADVLAALADFSTMVRVLGSYPRTADG